MFTGRLHSFIEYFVANGPRYRWPSGGLLLERLLPGKEPELQLLQHNKTKGGMHPLDPSLRGGTAVGLPAACCCFWGQCRAMLNQAWTEAPIDTTLQQGASPSAPAA